MSGVQPFHTTHAIVETHKIEKYLLSSTHPAGRAKAKFFYGFGFDAAKPDILKVALLDHAKNGTITAEQYTDFGYKWTIEGPMNSPDGRSPRILSVWVRADNEIAIRLVTAYPSARK